MGAHGQFEANTDRHGPFRLEIDSSAPPEYALDNKNKTRTMWVSANRESAEPPGEAGPSVRADGGDAVDREKNDSMSSGGGGDERRLGAVSGDIMHSVQDSYWEFHDHNDQQVSLSRMAAIFAGVIDGQLSQWDHSARIAR